MSTPNENQIAEPQRNQVIASFESRAEADRAKHELIERKLPREQLEVCRGAGSVPPRIGAGRFVIA